MFVYSLSGLELKDEAQQAVEIEENETTARSATFQVFAQFFTPPDAEHYERARDGQWIKELETAGELLSFPFDIGGETLPEDVPKADYEAEFARLFGAAESGTPTIWAGGHFDDREQNTAEVIRFYEYFGLQAPVDDPDLPPDHLATECDFMQYVTFKEAASPSPRLAGSYRRAQLDFHDRQLGLWIPDLTQNIASADPLPFFGWATERFATFVEADHAYLRELQGG